jgi:xanthine dehydrogenase YagT iron-sulfur-binding subunit
MRLTINGDDHELALRGPETLLAVLRDRLQLTGTKLGCARGECGACTVLVDGRLAYRCLTLAAGCAGQSITTIEGLASGDSLHPVQRAFMEHDALQCGYCTPGQVLAAAALLARHATPSHDDIRRGMSGNLCRCGTYPRIARAVQAAAQAMRAETSDHESRHDGRA